MTRNKKTIGQIEQDQQEEKEDKRSAPKEFVVDKDPQYGLFLIKYTAGGEVPDALKGKFTSISRAQAEIDNFLATREQQQQGS